LKHSSYPIMPSVRNRLLQVKKVMKRHPRLGVGGGISALFLLVGIFGPFISPHDPYAQDIRHALGELGTPGHWLGTDEFGRDLLSRIMYGSRLSLAIGGVSTFLGGGLGIVLGLVTGYFGRLWDQVGMRFVDFLMVFPSMLLALVIVVILGPSIGSLIVAIGVYALPAFARLTRGSVLVAKEKEFVVAARATGSSTVRILLHHILPECIAPLIVLTTFRMATAILTSTALSFIGLGAQPPIAEWGAMVSSGRAFIRTNPHLVLVPGLAITVTIFGLNLLGDGLRDYLDPRTR
jgi:peptide/nickel transport system permease protein